MRAARIALLLDWAPASWETRNEFHLRLCCGLRARGGVPILVVPRRLPDLVRSRFEENGAEVLTLDYNQGRYQYYVEVGKLIRKYSISLVHSRFFLYYSAIPWMARLHGVRRIVFTEATGGEWKPKSWKAHLVRLRARLACLPMTRLIAVSEFIKRRLVSLGIGEDRVVVVYNGVDVDRFTPDAGARERLAKDFPIGPDELVMATACNLVPIKHPEVLVEACGILAQRGVPVRLFVAGGGPMRADMELLSHKLGIADRTHWLGYHAYPERLFQACDVVVLPSVGEAFGNVLAEAMACGAPVVGSRSGGIGEVVEDGKTGLLARPLDPTAFADAIQKLAEDSTLRREMGMRGLERVRRNFTVDIAVEKTLEVYEST
ncbi:MAG: glycosyltransferase family 4 protein [Candidatus Binatia bacterium]